VPMLSADALIRLLDLAPLPVEGGHFRETWRSEVTLAADARDGRGRAAGTAIYYLLTDAPDDFSALHRLPTDEVYHFYLGDPVELVMLHPDGRAGTAVLGHDLAAGQRVQLVVPRGTWQGSRVAPGGRVALLGTTMAPGFDPADYEGGLRADLVARYPSAAPLIEALTRG